MKNTIRLAATITLATLTTSQLLSVSREDACAIIQVSLEENTAALNIAQGIISRYQNLSDFSEPLLDHIILAALDQANANGEASLRNNGVSIAEACSRAESGLQEEATQVNAEEWQVKESNFRNYINTALNQPNPVDLLTRMFIGLSAEDGRRAYEIYLEEERRRDAERRQNR